MSMQYDALMDKRRNRGFVKMECGAERHYDRTSLWDGSHDDDYWIVGAELSKCSECPRHTTGKGGEIRDCEGDRIEGEYGRV